METYGTLTITIEYLVTHPVYGLISKKTRVQTIYGVEKESAQIELNLAQERNPNLKLDGYWVASKDHLTPTR